MTLEWEQVIVHSVDPVALGQWWATALGWVVVHSLMRSSRSARSRIACRGWTSFGLMRARRLRTDCISTSGLMTRTPRWLVWWLMARSVLILARVINRGLYWQTPKVTSSVSLASDVNKWLARGAGLVTPRCGATGGLEDGGNPEEGRRLLALLPSIDLSNLFFGSRAAHR